MARVGEVVEIRTLPVGAIVAPISLYELTDADVGEPFVQVVSVQQQFPYLWDRDARVRVVELPGETKPPRIQCIILGLGLASKYADGECASRHDLISVRCRSFVETDEASLRNLGWFWSEESQAWEILT